MAFERDGALRSRSRTCARGGHSGHVLFALVEYAQRLRDAVGAKNSQPLTRGPQAGCKPATSGEPVRHVLVTAHYSAVMAKSIVPCAVIRIRGSHPFPYLRDLRPAFCDLCLHRREGTPDEHLRGRSLGSPILLWRWWGRSPTPEGALRSFVRAASTARRVEAAAQRKCSRASRNASSAAAQMSRMRMPTSRASRSSLRSSQCQPRRSAGAAPRPCRCR